MQETSKRDESPHHCSSHNLRCARRTSGTPLSLQTSLPHHISYPNHYFLTDSRTPACYYNTQSLSSLQLEPWQSILSLAFPAQSLTSSPQLPSHPMTVLASLPPPRSPPPSLLRPESARELPCLVERWVVPVQCTQTRDHMFLKHLFRRHSTRFPDVQRLFQPSAFHIIQVHSRSFHQFLLTCKVRLVPLKMTSIYFLKPCHRFFYSTTVLLTSHEPSILLQQQAQTGCRKRPHNRVQCQVIRFWKLLSTRFFSNAALICTSPSIRLRPFLSSHSHK